MYDVGEMAALVLSVNRSTRGRPIEYLLNKMYVFVLYRVLISSISKKNVVEFSHVGKMCTFV